VDFIEDFSATIVDPKYDPPSHRMRKASSNDVQQLVTMMDEFYAEGGYPLNRRRATEAFTALLANERLGFVLFIQAGAQDVGYVVVTLCYSMEYGGPNAFVDDLFVRKPFRGAGLGKAALAEVQSLCAKQGVRAIHVETGRDNAAAQAVYRRAGFAHTDRQLLTLKLAGATHEESDAPTSPPGADAAASPDQSGASQGLTADEQMALYEKDLKENDWGHQPC
jgi:GNAT superfamily N-acetyltransferase